jgi:hypothetical protein
MKYYLLKENIQAIIFKSTYYENVYHSVKLFKFNKTINDSRLKVLEFETIDLANHCLSDILFLHSEEIKDNIKIIDEEELKELLLLSEVIS